MCLSRFPIALGDCSANGCRSGRRLSGAQFGWRGNPGTDSDRGSVGAGEEDGETSDGAV